MPQGYTAPGSQASKSRPVHAVGGLKDSCCVHSASSTYADALALCGVDYLVVGPKVLATLKESQTLQVRSFPADDWHMLSALC